MSDSENLEEENGKTHPYRNSILRSFAFVVIFSVTSTAWKAYVIKMYKGRVGTGPIYPFNASKFLSNNSDPFINLPHIYLYGPMTSFIRKIYFIE